MSVLTSSSFRSLLFFLKDHRRWPSVQWASRYFRLRSSTSWAATKIRKMTWPPAEGVAREAEGTCCGRPSCWQWGRPPFARQKKGRSLAPDSRLPSLRPRGSGVIFFAPKPRARGALGGFGTSEIAIAVLKLCPGDPCVRARLAAAATCAKTRA